MIKYKLSDTLLELIKNGYGINNKYIKYDQIKKLKSISKEEDTFKFLEKQ